MKGTFSKVVLGLVLTIWPVTSFGQAVFGSINGTVSDPLGAAVAGAKVNITEIGKGVSYKSVTNDSGNYVQSHLTVGTYEVRIETPGVKNYVRKKAHVAVN